MSLYTIGGVNVNLGYTRYKNVDVYKLRNGDIVWDHKGTNAPHTRDASGCVTHGRDIYVLGGTLSGRHSNSVYKYSTEFSQWSAMKNMREVRARGPAVFILSGHLYAAGADKDLTFTKTMESLDISDGNSDWQIENIQLPFTIAYSKAVVVQGRAYIFGGSVSTTYKKNVISWSPGELEWKSMNNMSIGRASHCTATDGEDTVWVLGGCDPAVCFERGFIEQYTVSTNKWQQLNATPDIGRNYNRVNFCVYWQGFIYATFFSWVNNFRDYNIDTRFHIFDTVAKEWKVSSTTLNLRASHVIANIAP